MERMLTVDDVARILVVSRRTAYAKMKEFPHMEKPFRCTEAALRAFIAGNTVYPVMSVGKAGKRKYTPMGTACYIKGR